MTRSLRPLAALLCAALLAGIAPARAQSVPDTGPSISVQTVAAATSTAIPSFATSIALTAASPVTITGLTNPTYANSQVNVVAPASNGGTITISGGTNSACQTALLPAGTTGALKWDAARTCWQWIGYAQPLGAGTVLGNASGGAELATALGTLPAAVQDNITALGTVTTGLWNATPIGSAYGGLGINASSLTGIPQASSGSFTISTALANGTSATTQSESDTSAKLATDAFVSAIATLSSLTSVGTISTGTWGANISGATLTGSVNLNDQTLTGTGYFTGSVGVGINPVRTLDVRVGSTASSNNQVRVGGYQAAFEIEDEAGAEGLSNGKNYYFGVDDSNHSNICTGGGYSPGQELPPFWCYDNNLFVQIWGEKNALQLGYGGGNLSADAFQFYDLADGNVLGLILDANNASPVVPETELLVNLTQYCLHSGTDCGTDASHSNGEDDILIVGNASGGTSTSPAPCLAGSELIGISGREMLGTANDQFSDDAANVLLQATENCGLGHNGTAVTMQVTPPDTPGTEGANGGAQLEPARVTMFTLNSTGLEIGIVQGNPENSATGIIDYNNSTGTAAQSVIDFGNNAGLTQAQLILNGTGYSGGLGPNGFTIQSQAEMQLASLTSSVLVTPDTGFNFAVAINNDLAAGDGNAVIWNGQPGGWYPYSDNANYLGGPSNRWSNTFTMNLTLPGGTTPVFTTSAAITSGAGSGAGTLTNAPSAGNPTKWIPIKDDGTTRYVPAW